MIPNPSTCGRIASARAARHRATQKLHSRVIGCEARRGGRASERGFSLVELMVTLAVLIIVAAVAFAGFRRNEQQGQARRFISQVSGVMTQARNTAIDQQTQVQVTVDATSLSVTAFNPVTETWDLFERTVMSNQEESLIQGGTVCIMGLGTGVQTPAQAQATIAPAACLGAPQVLQFEPDGTFSDPGAAFSDVPNAGVTLWIGDRSIPGQIEYSIVQVFPGGLIRTIQELS